LENTGSDLVTNGGFASNTTSWSAVDSSLASVTPSPTQTGNCLEITRTGADNQYAKQTNVTLVVGKLYKLSVYVKSGTSGDEAFQMYAYDGTTVHNVSGTSTSSWVQHSIVFEMGGSDAVLNEITLQKATATTGSMLFDTVSLYEVTPGCVAANNLAMDGWLKEDNTQCLLYRQHSDGDTEAVSKVGSFYSLKCVASADTYIQYSFPANSPQAARFAGRTVTFGMWMKGATAGDVRLYFYSEEGGSNVYSFSDFNAGTGWEWIEFTKSCPSDLTRLQANIEVGTAGTHYFSQPMLVFGNSIGEGNYTRPVGEVVQCEKNITFLSNETISSDTDYNLESLSSGMIPKGTKAIYLRGQMVPNAQGDYFGVVHEGFWQTLTYSPTSNTNDFTARVNVEQSGTAPQIRIQRSATFTGVYFEATAIVLF
jgi:hypothetical protein